MPLLTQLRHKICSPPFGNDAIRRGKQATTNHPKEGGNLQPVRQNEHNKHLKYMNLGAKTLETLTAKALSLFDRGIKTFLSDPTTRQGIDGSTKYEPIEERDVLALMCDAHPEANLEVAVGSLVEVMALGVGVGTKAAAGEDSFKRLCEKYGVPDTVSCAGATGGRYYFFKHDDLAGFQEESGLKIFSAIDGLLVHPMKVDGELVDEVGPGMSILGYWDWVDGGVMAAEDVTEDEELPGVTEVAGPEAVAGSSCDERLTVEESSPEPEQTDDVQKQAPVAIVDPVALLRNEILSWVAAGDDKNAVLTKSLAWNKVQTVPIALEEIVSLVEEQEGVASAEVEELAGEELLFKLTEHAILFHDGLDDPYFHFEGVPFKAPSKEFEGIIQHRYYKKTKQMPKAKDLKNVMSILKSNASHEGPQVDLKNRVSDKDSAIIYDLRDRRYVRTTAQGWEVVPAFPLFYKHKHEKAQDEPVAGGDPWKVFDFIPIAEEHRLLIMVYLVSLFVPRIAHPVLAAFGDKGSAKSFFCNVINKLVDPTLTEKVIQPKNERDLIQTLRQKYVTVLDNLSKIDNRVSDILCQVCTGASISYRQLYTDQGENIAQFRHVVIINSINLVIVNDDLMDRSIILRFHRISTKDREPEEELWEAFEAARPDILGGIFDTLVNAMAIYPTIKVKKWPRLADFAKWGYAIAEALGQSGEQFVEDFSKNVKRQNESVAEKNVLCQTVIRLMSDKEVYLKTAGDALNALRSIAGEDAKDETFPKLPHLLYRGLEMLRSTLAEHDITFKHIDQRGASGFKILFSKTDTPVTSTVTGDRTPKPVIVTNAPNVPNAPASELPIVEFDEFPEVVNE